MNRTRLLTTMAILVAIGIVGSQFIWFPAGIARAYPVQHAVNVIAAVILGPGPAVIMAFLIGLLRNMLGLGTILAFPGGMVGALVAGWLYRLTGKNVAAVLGETFGTGIIGSLFAVPFARILMNDSAGALFFIPSFLVSSVSGALIGWFIISKVQQARIDIK